MQVAKISKKNKPSCNCNNISFFIFVNDNREIITAILKNIILRERLPISMNLPPPPITTSNNSIVRKILSIFFNLILYENIEFLDIYMTEKNRRFPHYLLQY